VDEIMVVENVRTCDVCRKALATYKCDLCGNDLCDNHSYLREVKIKSYVNIKLLYCQKCDEKQIHQSSINILRNVIVDNLKKAIVAVSLK
jgi:hypothetical protein